MTHEAAGGAGVDDVEVEIARLEGLLESGADISAPDYVSLVRRIGRLEPGRLIALGPRIFPFGLSQALRDGGGDALCEVTLMGAAVLDASGFHDGAIARIEQALTMAAGDEPTIDVLNGDRAFFNAFAGRVADARWQSRQPADHGLGGPRVRLTLAGVRCLLLDFEHLLTQDHGEPSPAGVADAGFLHVQRAAALAALGRVERAALTARTLLEASTDIGHRARQLDAEVALLGLRARTDAADVGDDLLSEAERLMNNHPLWKALLSRLRQQVGRGDRLAYARTVVALRSHHDWMNRGYRNSFPGLAQFSAALLDGEDVALPLPQAPTLLSLPNIPASAEAVAIGGTLSAAADWLAWLDSELPEFVVTSLEWPACRARVEALLLFRVGQREAAVERLGQSIACCEERGDTIEAEIGRAQVAAIVSDQELAEVARARLEAVGIEAALFASAAIRASERAAMAGEEPLTCWRRESSDGSRGG